VQVKHDLIVPVASLAGIAVLKLFAWFDRRTNDKDALDLYRVISTYEEAGNIDRLYGEEIRFTVQANYDSELAGAALLGSDARQLCCPEILTMVPNPLATKNFVERLAERIRLSRWRFQPEQLSRIISVVSSFTGQMTT